ncbi:hypothetical protein [Streptomyces violaceusniger]|nr:hypothetical protein [Streptomyces violaceusniger]
MTGRKVTDRRECAGGGYGLRPSGTRSAGPDGSDLAQGSSSMWGSTDQIIAARSSGVYFGHFLPGSWSVIWGYAVLMGRS